MSSIRASVKKVAAFAVAADVGCVRALRIGAQAAKEPALYTAGQMIKQAEDLRTNTETAANMLTEKAIDLVMKADDSAELLSVLKDANDGAKEKLAELVAAERGAWRRLLTINGLSQGDATKKDAENLAKFRGDVAKSEECPEAQLWRTADTKNAKLKNQADIGVTVLDKRGNKVYEHWTPSKVPHKNIVDLTDAELSTIAQEKLSALADAAAELSGGLPLTTTVEADGHKQPAALPLRVSMYNGEEKPMPVDWDTLLHKGGVFGVQRQGLQTAGHKAGKAGAIGGAICGVLGLAAKGALFAGAHVVAAPVVVPATAATVGYLGARKTYKVYKNRSEKTATHWDAPAAELGASQSEELSEQAAPSDQVEPLNQDGPALNKVDADDACSSTTGDVETMSAASTPSVAVAEVESNDDVMPLH